MTPEHFAENLKYYEYLFELQESAVCNMFESPNYLERHRHFGLDKEKSIQVAQDWMNNYAEIREKYDAQVEKELADLTEEEIKAEKSRKRSQSAPPLGESSM